VGPAAQAGRSPRRAGPRGGVTGAGLAAASPAPASRRRHRRRPRGGVTGAGLAAASPAPAGICYRGRVTIPSWIFFLVAVWVLAFGVFRLSVAFRRREQDPDRPNFRRRGLLAQPPRRHALFGVVYLILGSCLVAMGLGWHPNDGFGGCGGGEPPSRSIER